MSKATPNPVGETLVGGAAGRDRKTANRRHFADPGRSRFQNLIRAEFTDIDALCSAVRDWDLDFRPLGKPATENCVARIIQSRGAGVHFAYARFSLNIDQHGAPPPGCVTFGVLEESVRRLWWRGHDVDGRAVLVFPAGGELSSISGADFAVYTISIENSFCAEICSSLRLGLPPGRTLPEVFMPPPAVLASLRRCLRLLVDQEAQPSDAATTAIAEALVKAWANAVGSQRRRDRCGYGPERTMRKALELFGDSNWPMLTASDLCRHACVSERTLQNAFRQRFGTTPAAFLKARRLAAVYAMLRSNGEANASVGDIAAQYGFWHSGQFAADYKRSFGELPSDTLNRTASRKNGGLPIDNRKDGSPL